MKTKFDNIKKLSNKKLFEGIKYCFDNSNDLYSSALALKRNKKYSVATSILTLSIEELVKSLTLFIVLISEPEEREIFRDVFESNDLHKSRHGFALFMNEYLKAVNLKKIVKANIQLETPEELSAYLQTKIDFNKIASNVEKEKKTFNNWFDQANERKNAGLYVAYNNKWFIPTRINEKEFSKALKETKKIRTDLSLILNYLFSIDNNDLSKFIVLMKQTMKQFEAGMEE